MFLKEKKVISFQSIPVGNLSIIALDSCKNFSIKVNNYIVTWRKYRKYQTKNFKFNKNYYNDSYLINTQIPRFGSGEAKGVINESIRGNDVYIIIDICNYNLFYSLFGYKNRMSPDDHFQNLKRIIAAIGGKARRINIIMPFLYESRQHKRSGRESLDCAIALQELINMGVDNIITFDAHDPRVQNAIPLHGFESIQPSYQFIKGIFKIEHNFNMTNDNTIIISPDIGSADRTIYLANILGINIGMFYKRRDYSTIINGKNPIIAHEFLGSNIYGKNIIIIDDMISSGDSILEVISLLKSKGADKIFICATFGLFTNGLKKFDKAFKNNEFYRLLSTNLIYQSPELLKKKYYINCDMSKYVAFLIDTLNHDNSISNLLNPMKRINQLLIKHKNNFKY